MFISIIPSIITALSAFSLCTSVALHDSRFDKVFAMTAVPSSEVSQHDFSQAVSHELHVHSGQSVSDAVSSDPGLRARSHTKHTALHHSRYKLATLIA
jgi:hypothetical protein